MCKTGHANGKDTRMTKQSDYQAGYSAGQAAGERATEHRVDVLRARCEFLEASVRELEAFVEQQGFRVSLKEDGDGTEN